MGTTSYSVLIAGLSFALFSSDSQWGLPGSDDDGGGGGGGSLGSMCAWPGLQVGDTDP